MDRLSCRRCLPRLFCWATYIRPPLVCAHLFCLEPPNTRRACAEVCHYPLSRSLQGREYASALATSSPDDF